MVLFNLDAQEKKKQQPTNKQNNPSKQVKPYIQYLITFSPIWKFLDSQI